jgi:hypothetical protein
VSARARRVNTLVRPIVALLRGPRADYTPYQYQHESPVDDNRLLLVLSVLTFDFDARIPRINRTLVYLGACIIDCVGRGNDR